MRRGWGPQSLALLLFLLVRLSLPGDGNEGSSAGSCSCHKTFSSHSPPTDQYMNHFREKLTDYNRCPPFVRFRLLGVTVCGGSKDPWVIELIRCFEHRECGYARSAYSGRVVHQEHLPSPSTQVPVPTERKPAVMDISAQTYLPSTLKSTHQPTLLVGALSLDKKLTHTNETTTSSVGPSLVTRPEAGENQKHLKENVGPTAGISVIAPVLSLLVIVFILTAVLLYVLCKRQSKQPLQYSPDLQLHYRTVASDSNPWAIMEAHKDRN